MIKRYALVYYDRAKHVLQCCSLLQEREPDERDIRDQAPASAVYVDVIAHSDDCWSDVIGQ